MNDSAYLEYIGDKGVKTVADAETFLKNVAMKSYDENGFGHYVVELKSDGTPIGTCGYVNRDELDHPDIGFAFLPAFRKHSPHRQNRSNGGGCGAQHPAPPIA